MEKIGIINKASVAKKLTQAASEKEALEQLSLLAQMHKHTSPSSPDPYNKYYVGKKLIDKNISDWDIISINDTQTIYGTGWNYIEAGTNIEDYGTTNSNWLVNYETGEIIELKENEYVEVSSSDGLAVTNGLVFNIDSKNMNTADPTTWGGGATLYGFDNTAAGDIISLDGVDDYIEFQAGDDFEDGFTFSFYGIIRSNGLFFAKQRENSMAYSCRFGVNGPAYFNTSKISSGSDWQKNDGMMYFGYKYKIGEKTSFDIKFEPLENKFSLYRDGIFEGSTIVNSDYWNGTNGGKKIFEDTSIKCYIGRNYSGSPADWHCIQVDIYSLRLYNRPLTDNEISQNYNKNVAYHNLNQ